MPLLILSELQAFLLMTNTKTQNRKHLGVSSFHFPFSCPTSNEQKSNASERKKKKLKNLRCCTFNGSWLVTQKMVQRCIASSVMHYMLSRCSFWSVFQAFGILECPQSGSKHVFCLSKFPYRVLRRCQFSVFQRQTARWQGRSKIQ